MFVSLSLGKNAAHPTEDPSSGAILRTELNASTGQLESKVARRFPECIWMEGIAVSSDCMTIAALCRRHFGDKDYTFDSLATHADKEWMTQPNCADQEMWLYEWTNGDIQSEPKKYVVHRAVGTSWEYGNNYLRIGESDNTYGIGIKARVFGGGGCHEADALLVMNRTNHNLLSRGYPWACGTGHTLFNHPTFNPATKKYAVLCGTDGSNNGGPLGGLFLRIEDRSANEFYDTNYSGLRIKGGVGALRPLTDGGYLGIIVGVNGSVTAQDNIPLEPPTSIGLARFDSSGALVGKINWVVNANRKYLSYPQLAPLGNDRFLLGWGEMYDLDRRTEMNDEAYRIPLTYYLMEIDNTGTQLTSPQALDGVGWGEQDEMISLGNGRVGWAYIPNPELANINAPPSCNSDSLQLTVYKAAQ
jgi:hypothetical protein